MLPIRFVRLALGLVLSITVCTTARAQTNCQPQWLPTFGAQTSLNNPIWSLEVFDDGSGPALFAGGNFTIAGGVLAARVAKWDGRRWSALGSGVSGTSAPEIFAMTVFDDGSGPALYVGGRFTDAGGIPAAYIARWDGAHWSALGGGLSSPARSLAVYDDGSGPALYVGGDFSAAGGAPALHLAKWDGVQWSEVGGGVAGGVYALRVFDDGSGPALCVGGGFASVGGTPASCIARWNGSQWSTFGAGIGGGVDALAVFDDGTGSALFAGGLFSSAGGSPADFLAKWDGTQWTSLGLGVDRPVYALGVHDFGNGPVLCAGGELSLAGGAPVKLVAAWDGAQWSAVGANLSDSSGVRAFAEFDAGAGPELIAGGAISAAGDPWTNAIARWKGTRWGAIGNGGLEDSVTALSKFDDGSGEQLYAGGWFESVRGMPANDIASWDGQDWHALGSGLEYPGGQSAVLAETVFDDGSGPALYVGGRFTLAGGLPAIGVARWRSGSWTALGSGLHLQGGHGWVTSLCVYDDGAGPALYVGGAFDQAGSVAAHNIARWNGSTWSALSSGTDAPVETLATYDEGSGPALFAGGNFYVAGGVSAINVARWNGAAWSAVGQSVIAQGGPDCMAVFDDGAGPALYVGGYFDTQGGSAGNGILKWNGTSWSALGSGLAIGFSGGAYALAVFDDGGGRALFVGGSFSSARGVPVHHIARWDGSSWGSVGSGMSPNVQALASFDDGSGPALYAGGWFLSCFDSGDSFLAKWGQPAGCTSPGTSICEPGVAGTSACPCSNPPSATGRGCDNSSATGGAQLTASGAARVSNDTLVLATSGETATATSVVLQGDAQIASGVVFGQGVRCVAGSLKRLYVKTAVGGSISAPLAGDPSVSARSAALGDTLAQGMHRSYGVFYRDPTVLGGCPATSTFNITQQLDVLWYP